MKIGVVCPYDLSLSGGVQNIVRQMHERFWARGHKAKIISVLPESRIDLKEVAFFGKATPVLWNGAMSSFNFGSIATGRETASYLKKEKFDVLLIHEPLIPLLNIEVMNFTGTPKIGWFHATTINDPWEFPTNLIVEPVQMWLRSKLSGMVAISTSSRQVWKKVFGREGIIISGGVDTAKYANAPVLDLGDKEEIKLLFVGRLDARKGILDLMRAMSMVPKSVKWKLWIVGNGPQMAEAWEMVAKHGLGGNVRFVGRVSDKDLPGYFKAADIYCAPSWGGESLGLVLLEAMAAGTPIVAYSNPGYRYTLNGYPWENGLVPVKSVRKLAESITELATNSELRRRVSEWEVEKVKNFDWEVMTDKFLEYAQKVVKGTGRG